MRRRYPPPGVVAHDFPIRPDLIVSIQLPVDLNRGEADRVAEFVRSLAFADSIEKGEADG